jgi:hypothetical protein
MVPGCYGKGIMGWGSNGTQFEVERGNGFIEVTIVGNGAMKAVPSGASPEYTGERTRWDEFALQFREPGVRISFERPANRSSSSLSPGKPFPLSLIAIGEAELGQRLYFCADAEPTKERAFGVIIHGSFGGYNLWFERLPLCG